MRAIYLAGLAALCAGCMVSTTQTVSGEDAVTVMANRCAAENGIALTRPVKADWDTTTNAVGFDYPDGLSEDQKVAILRCTADKIEARLAR